MLSPRFASPLLLLLLVGCADSVPSGPAPRGPAPPQQAYRLDGPFADLPAIWRQCQGGWNEATSVTTVLAERRAPGGPAVSLRAFSDSPAASACAVTIETGAGLYVGPSFLCAADRSDERISAREVTVSLTATAATIDFDISYLQGDLDRPPTISHRQIHCDLTGSAPRCTTPPNVGGYDLDLCETD